MASSISKLYWCVSRGYFPEILFSSKLEPLLNPYREATFLGDKNFLSEIWGDIPDLHIPQTYASCVNGFFRDQEGHLTSINKIASTISKLKKKCVIKKTVNSNSGRDVLLFDPDRMQFYTSFIQSSKGLVIIGLFKN